MVRNGFIGAMLALPFGISLFAAYQKSGRIALAAFFAMFLIVAAAPVFRHRESLWLFVMTAYTSIPINWFIANKYIYYLVNEEMTKRVWGILTVLECMLILASIQEVIVGLIGRAVWRRQYRIRLP